MKNINLKEIRKELDLTQEEFAKKIGVSRQTVINYENGMTIPESKRDLLYNILQESKLHIQEPPPEYQPKSGYECKIQKIKEEIEVRSNIIIESQDNELVEHQKKMIDLLYLQLKEINKAIESTTKEKSQCE